MESSLTSSFLTYFYIIPLCLVGARGTIPFLLNGEKFSSFALKDTVNKMQSTHSVRGHLTLEVGNLRLADLVRSCC